MKETFQDDAREEAMRQLFGLYKKDTDGRSGVDAYLNLDGEEIPFELKTTSNGSVTTVRDFGPEHISKWSNKHWLIGFFIEDEIYYKYASPEKMSKWIQEKKEYIEPDFKIADIVHSKIVLTDLYYVLGEKSEYTYKDAKSLHKNQYSKKEYISLQDIKNGYSPQRMLEILKDRGKYIIERGSTLNNPHIPFSYFSDLEKITDKHSEKLRSLVRKYIGTNKH
ncbi:hypothetical protein ACN4FU_00140 [Aliarcobacter butzleri]|uniref:hypothetical protein n=1 Tax=Aliarcobacter butzleri TaxID=28197 RepID=UPI003AF47654